MTTRRLWLRSLWGAAWLLVGTGWLMRATARLGGLGAHGSLEPTEGDTASIAAGPPQRKGGEALPKRKGARRLVHRLERWWARRVVRFLRIGLEIEGLQHVDRKASYVVVSLHEGFADALALLHLPLDLVFVARDELFEWPLLGGYLRDSNQVIISTPDSRRGYREMLRRGREVSAAGESLVVFAQGSILGIEVALQPGALRLARSLGLPVLPVVLTGSHRVWEYPYTARLRYGCRMSMQVLPPVIAEDLEAGELQDRMKAQALDGRMAPPRRFDPDLDGYWDGYPYQIDPAFPDLFERVARHRGAVEP
ncbi:MAG: lysophospholipid acyltransferase family protein [Acidimicrobiia bacterium]